MICKLKESKTKWCKSIFLSQACESYKFPKLYSSIIFQLFSYNSILNDSYITYFSSFFIITSHFRMNHHEKIRILWRSFFSLLKVWIRIKIIKILLKPILPVKILKFHDLKFVMIKDSSKPCETSIHRMLEIIKLILFTFLKNVIYDPCILLLRGKLPFSGWNFLYWSVKT